MKIPIFCIHNPQELKRGEFMQKEMKEIGLDFSFFDAVMYQGEEYAGMRKPEIGCALSHFALIDKIISEKIPCAMIIEDDVFFDKKFKNVYDFLCQQSHFSWDYLHCNYYIYNSHQRSLYRQTLKKEIEKNFSKIFGAIFVRYPGICLLAIWDYFLQLFAKITKKQFFFISPMHFYTCTGCYFLTYEGACKIRDFTNKKVTTYIDHLPYMMRKKGKLSVKILVPQLVFQNDNLESTISLGKPPFGFKK